jgi:hypothetical protein
MAVIDPALKDFLESGLAVMVATRSADLLPTSLRGWGPRISEDGAGVTVFIDRPAAAEMVANLRDNGRISMCVTDVLSLRSVQLKGRCVEIGDPRAEDLSHIDDHRKAFTENCGAIGFPAPVIRNLWSTQVVKLRFLVEDIFDQTPGPKAGAHL